MNRRMVRQCAMCGKAFISRQGRGQYCGNTCKDRAWRGMHLLHRECPVCGKEFDTFDVKHVYCSAECRNAAKRERRGIPEKTCVVCGKPIPRLPGGRKTCSPECFKINERRQKNLWARRDWAKKKAERAAQPPKVFEGVCPICGRTFTAKSSWQKYCSAECRNAFKRRGERFIYRITCGECGKEFMAQRRTQRFCSKSCAMKWLHKMGIAPGQKPVDVFENSCAAADDDDMIYGNMVYF